MDGFRIAPRHVVLTALAASLLVLSGCVATRIQDSLALARRSEPLQRDPPDASLRLLIVGDSTGVGTGASTPQLSVAGLIASAYPMLRIENRARDGATFADIAGQLAGGGRFDMVLVQGGGNDVIRLRRLEGVREDVERLLERALARAPTVVLMPCGNVGNASFFFPPASWLMTSRSRALQAIVRDAADRRGAVYVNLSHERADDPFVRDRSLEASDGLHPSDAGYRSWFDTLSSQAELPRRLRGAAGPAVSVVAGAFGSASPQSGAERAGHERLEPLPGH